MKSKSIGFFVLAILFTFSNSFAQHTLQIDDGAQHYSIINGSTSGGNYTLQNGGGMIITTGGGTASLAWLQGGNTNGSPAIPGYGSIGTLDNVPMSFVTNGLGNVRMTLTAAGLYNVFVPTNITSNSGTTTALAVNNNAGLGLFVTAQSNTAKVSAGFSDGSFSTLMIGHPSNLVAAIGPITTQDLRFGSFPNPPTSFTSNLDIQTATGFVGVGTITPSGLFSVGTGATSPFTIDNSGNTVTSGNVTVNTGYISPSVGQGSLVHGIEWPNNPGGGGGDRAFIHYFLEPGGTGENTKLQIGIENDAEDDLSLWQNGAERLDIFGGNIFIGNTTPATATSTSLLNVGATNQFQVDGSGNIAKIKNLTYSWPAALPASTMSLASDPSGNLSWIGSLISHITETYSTSAPYDAVNHAAERLQSTGAATAIDLVLSPKATGALQAQLADGTPAGGNLRGSNAVDWQMTRGGAGTQTQVASGANAVIGGGQFNTSSNSASTVAGGSTNTASGQYSFIGGGQGNNANNTNTTIGGGSNNSASNVDAVVAGGIQNTASGPGSFIGGGGFDGTTTSGNTANGGASVVGGGITNSAGGIQSFVGGGQNNSASTNNATIGGGVNNVASGKGSFIGGGGYDGTTVSGNIASGNASTVGGGLNNQATLIYSAVGGGLNNTASGTANGRAFVGGGYNNTAGGDFSVVGGGFQNGAGGGAAFVGGGALNLANGFKSTVGGGNANIVNGSYSAIPGGSGLTLSNDGSFGFLGNNNSNSHNMTVANTNTSVFGNTDLWLANNDNSARALDFYQPYNTAGAFPNGTFYSGFKASATAQSDNYLYTWPSTAPVANQSLVVTAIAGTNPINATLGWVSAPSGSGTTNTIPKWTSATALGNSSITDNGTTVSTAESVTLATASGTSNTFGNNAATINQIGQGAGQNIIGFAGITNSFGANATTNDFGRSFVGTVTNYFGSSSTGGNAVDSIGIAATAASSATTTIGGGPGTTTVKLGAFTTNGLFQTSAGNGTLAFIPNGTGVLTNNGSGVFSWTANPPSGSGTTNTIPKWTSATVLGNSLLTDDGTTLTYTGTGGGSFTTLASSAAVSGGADLNVTNSSATAALHVGENINVNGVNAGGINEGLAFAVTGGASNYDLVGTGNNWFVTSAGTGVFSAGITVAAGVSTSVSNTIQWRNTSNGTLTTASLGAPRTWTLPDATGNISLTTSAGTALFTGPTVARTYTLPDANGTLLTTTNAVLFDNSTGQTATDGADLFNITSAKVGGANPGAFITSTGDAAGNNATGLTVSATGQGAAVLVTGINVSASGGATNKAIIATGSNGNNALVDVNNSSAGLNAAAIQGATVSGWGVIGKASGASGIGVEGDAVSIGAGVKGSGSGGSAAILASVVGTGYGVQILNTGTGPDIAGTTGAFANWSITHAGQATFADNVSIAPMLTVTNSFSTAGATNAQGAVISSTGAGAATGTNTALTVTASGNAGSNYAISATAGNTQFSYATVASAAAITIPTNSTVIEITSGGAGVRNNLITMPAVAAADNGRILYIHNGDTNPTTGTVINAGATATFVCSGAAWQRVGP